MRVLFIGENEIDRPEQRLIEALHAQCDAFHLMMGPGHPRGEALAAAGVPFTPLRLRTRVDLPGIRAIRAELRRGAYDIVHCVGSHKQVSNAAFAARGLPVRLVGYRGTLGHLHRWDPFSHLSYLHPRVDGIICCAEAVRRFLAGLGVPDRKLVTIHKGHDPAWYAAPTVDRRRLGVPDNACLVVCAARIRPVKGVDVLLEAVARLSADPAVVLLLVGPIEDDHVARRLQAMAGDPRVIAIGPREDAPAVIGAADVFVMPSRRREGLPRAVIEAMMQGVPAVVSDVGGMPELVEHGVSGLVVPPGEAPALAGALAELARDAACRRTMGAAARARMQRDFHIDRTVRETLAWYAQLGPSA